MPRAVIRLAGAALIVAALCDQLLVTVRTAIDSPTPYGAHIPTVVANFFSFFTVESNVLAAFTLIIAAVWALTHGQRATVEPLWLGVLIACAATYMIVTGIVYNVLLREVQLPQGTTVVWANEVLHVIAPLLMLAMVFLAPQRRRLGWSTLGIIVIFPVVWAIYTMTRANLIVAPATGEPYWYPYPFLDPNLVAGGYLGVAGYIIGIAVAIVTVGAGVVWMSRKRGTEAS